MQPTLLILAAGMGSRYGGLKQLDGVGPNEETIMDYSVFDAARAGFGKAVFVIREHFKEEFREKVVRKYSRLIETELVTQESDKLPAGFELNPAREKPWGTGHAMLVAEEAVKTPFAVINADDYYGRHSFEILGRNLAGLRPDRTGDFSMVGFHLSKTLSESGGVSRGICTVDERRFLTAVEEHHKIEEKEGIITGEDSAGTRKILDPESYTSMNMWGFTPEIFAEAEKLFRKFLRENGNDPKKEFYIPFIVNSMIESGKAGVQVLETPDKWFGVTYKEDRPTVTGKLKSMTEQGLYPAPLFPDQIRKNG